MEGLNIISLFTYFSLMLPKAHGSRKGFIRKTFENYSSISYTWRKFPCPIGKGTEMWAIENYANISYYHHYQKLVGSSAKIYWGNFISKLLSQRLLPLSGFVHIVYMVPNIIILHYLCYLIMQSKWKTHWL